MASIIYCLLHCDWYSSKCKTTTLHHSSIISKLFSLTTAVICNCIYIATIASNELANLVTNLLMEIQYMLLSVKYDSVIV